MNALTEAQASKEAIILAEFLQAIEAAFVLGEFGALAQHYSLPTVIYSEAGATIIQDEAQFVAMFNNYKDMLHSKQITQSHHQILAQEPTINRRKKVSVRFTKFHSSEEAPVTNDVKLFLHFDHNDEPKIEMLEYLTLPTTVDDIENLLS